MKQFVNSSQKNLHFKWKKIKNQIRRFRKKEQLRLMYLRRLKRLHKKKLKRQQALKKQIAVKQRRETAKLNRTLKRRHRR